MGLFDGNQKRDALDNAIMEKMAGLDIVDDIVGTIAQGELPWLHQCMSYYDSCQRNVTITSDVLEILWHDQHSEPNAKGEAVQIVDGNERAGYRFTKSGYMPISAHLNEKGKEDVPMVHVILLLANVVIARLKQAMPGTQFSTPIEVYNRVTFSYTLPRPSWKPWF